MYNIKKLGIRVLTPLLALFIIASYSIPANAETISSMHETNSVYQQGIQLAEKMQKFVKNNVKESSLSYMATSDNLIHTANSNVISPSDSIVSDTYGFEIRFSPTDVKIMMTVGITAGFLIGVAGLIFGGDGAIAVVYYYTLSESTFIAVLGAALGASIAIWQTWWNDNGFTVYLPYETIVNKANDFVIGPGIGSQFWNNYHYYEI